MAAPAAQLNAPSKGAPTYLVILRWNSILSRSASSNSPAAIRSSCWCRYASNFSLAFFNPQTGNAECVSQCGCEPSSTASSPGNAAPRSEEHTSELQSRGHLVCRLLLEKKKTQTSKAQQYQICTYTSV